MPSPTGLEWINHIWMNSKMAGCEDMRSLIPEESGKIHIWEWGSIG